MAFNANLANAFLSAAITASATSITLQSGQGANMPTTLPYKLTIVPFGQMPTKANSEIVLVTAISTDTLTVTRGVAGTTARAFSVGDVISNGIYIENSTAIGDIFMSLRATPAAGRLFMDGGTYNKADWPLLYKLVQDNAAYGTTGGSVGTETFTLADMSERMPFGKSSNSPFTTLGYKSGNASITLSSSQMPSHSHSIPDFVMVGSRGGSGYNSGLGVGGGGYTKVGQVNDTSGTLNTGGNGSGSPINILNPTITVNYEVVAG